MLKQKTKLTPNMPANHSYFVYIWNNFKKDKIAITGLVGIILLVLAAIFAPLIANARPLCIFGNKGIEFPFFYYIFSPNSAEELVAKTFNLLMLYIAPATCLFFLLRKSKKTRLAVLLILPLLLAIPFFSVKKP